MTPACTALPSVSADVPAVTELLRVEYNAEVVGRGVSREKRESFAADDPVAYHLDAEGLIEHENGQGHLIVECPWADEHTPGTGRDAAWLPAGTNGYERGHFNCFHASCAGRTDDEFLDEIGMGVADDFEVLPAVVDGPAVAPLGLIRDKQGRIEASVRSVSLALENPRWFGHELAHDDFLGLTVVRKVGEENWQPLTDAMLTRLRRGLEEVGFKPVAVETARACVDAIADGRHIDSAISWLRSLEWDGIPRVDHFLTKYLGAEEGPYTSAVARYWWTALAGRVLVPGCQVDMVPAMIGLQGGGKTSLLRAIAPVPEAYASFDLGKIDNDDTARRQRGVIVGELGELRGLRTTSQEAIKDWITRRFEKWTLKFKEHERVFPRRMVLFASGNKEQFLADASGERRWLPFKVGAVDRSALWRDREQLWAEGAALFDGQMAAEEAAGVDEPTGVMWRDALALGRLAHAGFKMENVNRDRVEHWLWAVDTVTNTYPAALGYVKLADVLGDALGLGYGKINRADQMEVADILTELGLTRKQVRIEGKQTWIYVLPATDLA